MKKILIIFTLTILSFLPSRAIDEIAPIELKDVILESEVEKVQESPKITDIEIPHEKTFKEKVHEILEGEVERTDVPYHILADKLTLHTQKGPVESLHLWGSILPQVGLSMGHDAPTTVDYSEGHFNVGIDGKFRGGKEDFRLMFNFNPLHNRTFWQNLPADLYIATNRTRTTVSCSDFTSPYDIEGDQAIIHFRSLTVLKYQEPTVLSVNSAYAFKGTTI